ITGANATFTNATTTNATSTNLYAASAVIPTLTGTFATFTGATSTSFFSTTGSSTNLFAQNASLGSTTIAALTAGDIISKGPTVDVRAYGAKGDGITDDTQAINAA